MYSGGYPGNVYGGLLASLLDCHGQCSSLCAPGTRAGDGGRRPIRYVTGSLKMDYRLPTPLGVELVIEGALRLLEGRKALIDLQLSAGGQVCVTGEMVAVLLPAQH